MEDYIFIIIAIVLSIFGAINQSKKKKMAQMNNEEDPAPRPSIFDQIFEEPEFQEPTPQIIPPAPLKVTPLKRETLKPSQHSMSKKEKVETTKRVIRTSFSEEAEKVETGRESVMNDFSLKKAIIYSEILNRKY